MMIAKEYIDRIDFIYLFYLSFYVKSVFQWSQPIENKNGNVFPIIFPNICFISLSICNREDREADSRYTRTITTHILDNSSFWFIFGASYDSEDSYSFHLGY